MMLVVLYVYSKSVLSAHFCIRGNNETLQLLLVRQITVIQINEAKEETTESELE